MRQPHENFQNVFTYVFYDLHTHNKFIINMAKKTVQSELEQSTKDIIIGMNTAG